MTATVSAAAAVEGMQAGAEPTENEMQLGLNAAAEREEGAEREDGMGRMGGLNGMGGTDGRTAGAEGRAGVAALWEHTRRRVVGAVAQGDPRALARALLQARILSDAADGAGAASVGGAGAGSVVAALPLDFTLVEDDEAARARDRLAAAAAAAAVAAAISHEAPAHPVVHGYFFGPAPAYAQTACDILSLSVGKSPLTIALALVGSSVAPPGLQRVRSQCLGLLVQSGLVSGAWRDAGGELACGWGGGNMGVGEWQYWVEYVGVSVLGRWGGRGTIFPIPSSFHSRSN